MYKNFVKIYNNINKIIRKLIVYIILKFAKSTFIIIITIKKLNTNKLLKYKDK